MILSAKFISRNTNFINNIIKIEEESASRTAANKQHKNDHFNVIIQHEA